MKTHSKLLTKVFLLLIDSECPIIVSCGLNPFGRACKINYVHLILCWLIDMLLISKIFFKGNCFLVIFYFCVQELVQ